MQVALEDGADSGSLETLESLLFILLSDGGPKFVSFESDLMLLDGDLYMLMSADLSPWHGLNSISLTPIPLVSAPRALLFVEERALMFFLVFPFRFPYHLCLFHLEISMSTRSHHMALSNRSRRKHSLPSFSSKHPWQYLILKVSK